MIERVLAALVFAVCAALLLRLLVGERRRYRIDSALRRVWAKLRRAGSSLGRWRSARRDAETAARVADEAIRRARTRASKDGNVYTPESFRKPPRDKMH